MGLAAGLLLLEGGWAAQARADQPPPAGATSAGSSSGSQTPFRYDAKGRRDPFLPLVWNGKLITPIGQRLSEGAQPELDGILFDPAGDSIALVNGQEARVGEVIGGYRVVEIRQDAVVLEGGEGPVVLRIFEPPPDSSAGPQEGGERP
jgi:hypothetical protein